jgi:hypothetical protein
MLIFQTSNSGYEARLHHIRQIQKNHESQVPNQPNVEKWNWNKNKKKDPK